MGPAGSSGVAAACFGCIRISTRRHRPGLEHSLTASVDGERRMRRERSERRVESVGGPAPRKDSSRRGPRVDDGICDTRKPTGRHSSCCDPARSTLSENTASLSHPSVGRNRARLSGPRPPPLRLHLIDLPAHPASSLLHCSSPHENPRVAQVSLRSGGGLHTSLPAPSASTQQLHLQRPSRHLAPAPELQGRPGSATWWSNTGQILVKPFESQGRPGSATYV